MYHGKVIPSKDLARILPDREVFVRDQYPEDYKGVEAQINQRKELMFMPCAVTDDHFRQDDSYGYRIVVNGSLMDGRNATVILTGVQPFFYIKLKNANEKKKEAAMVKKSLDTLTKEQYHAATGQNPTGKFFRTAPTKVGLSEKKTFIGYCNAPASFLKLSFDTLFARRHAIQYLRAQQYETFSDSTSKYFRAVCSQHQTTFSNWVTLQNYEVDLNHHYIDGMVLCLDIGDYLPFRGDILDNPKLMNDRTMSMAWDIETYAPSGTLPTPSRAEDRIFMIGATFQWYWSKEVLLRVCLVDHPSASHPDFLTVHCTDEKDLLLTFAELFKLWRPSIILAFNNYDYDYPWVFQRASQHRIFGDMIQKMEIKLKRDKASNKQPDGTYSSFNYTQVRIKIDASNNQTGHYISSSAFVNTDVMMVFQQLFPRTSEYSLNFFLKKHSLGTKLDMPISEMFETYAACLASGGKLDETLRQKMSQIAHYCVVDCQKTHELLLARFVVKDRREVAHLSYTSLADAFDNADGMKVRNLVMSEGNRRGFVFTDRVQRVGSRQQYGGALVFDPLPETVIPKLTMRQRKHIAETMPETEAYNKYQAWKDVTVEEIAEWERLGECKEDTPACVQEFFKERSEYPIVGLDYSSLYPSIIMCYNLSPEYMITDPEQAAALADKHKIKRIETQIQGETVVGYGIQHENCLDETRPDYKFGLFPHILRKLFNERSRLKKQFLNPLKEKLEKLHLDKGDPEEIEECEQRYNYWDSKQKALKVLMNTFYGESGNQESSMYMKEISSGITSLGQHSLLLARSFVEGQGCKVHYGDTDSLYLSMAPRHFADLDRQYYSNQMTVVQYCTALIERTFELARTLQGEVNAFLKADNGTDFLKMAYEEVLMPAMFQTKKKYFGRPHENMVNFESKIFIKGLEIQKRTSTPFMDVHVRKVLDESMNIENLFSVMDLVKLCLKEVCTTNWTDKSQMHLFVKTARYNPNKNNVAVLNFFERMKAKGIVLKSTERFKYVVIKKYDWEYDLNGVQKVLSQGDRIELYSVAMEDPEMVIDVHHYVKTLIGQLVLFIMYDRRFAPAVPNPDPKKQFEYLKKQAVKFLEGYVQQFLPKYQNVGAVYKKTASQVSKLIKLPDRSRVMTLLNAILDTSCGEPKGKAGSSMEELVRGMMKATRERLHQPMHSYIDRCYPLDLKRAEDRAKLKALQREYAVGPRSILSIEKRFFQKTEKVVLARIKSILQSTNIAQKKESALQQCHALVAKRLDLDALKSMPSSDESKAKIKAAADQVKLMAEDFREVVHGSLDMELEKTAAAIREQWAKLEFQCEQLCKAEITVEYLREKANKYMRIATEPSAAQLQEFQRQIQGDLSRCDL